MRYSKLKKRIKKIASVSVAATMLINNLAFAEIALPFRNFIITAFAVEPEGTERDIKSMNQLAEFARNYTHDNKNDTLAINFVDEESYDPNSFISIARSADDAFSGKITINLTTNDHALILDKPLFGYLSTDAEIEFITDANSATLPQYLEIRRYGTDGTPILANHVVQGSKGTTNTWKIMPTCYSVGSGDQIEYYPGASSGIIGSLDSGEINLDVRNDALSVDDNIVNNFTGTGNVGALVNEMASGTTLNVINMTGSNNAYSVSATGATGNAGGIVGQMGDGAYLNLCGVDSSFITARTTINSAAGYAGGLVGYAENATISFPSTLTSITINDIVKGKEGAGGLFGFYSIGDNWSELKLTQFDFPSSNKLTVGVTEDTSNFVNNPDGFAGGLFGELLNENDDATAFSISDGSTDSAYASVYVALASDSKKADAFGGLIGKYSANKVGHSLTISGVNVANNGAPITTVNVEGCATYPNHLGGVVGRIDGDAYVTINDMNISASKVNYANNFFEFGGAVGYVEKGFINVEDLTVTSIDKDKAFQGGGVIGSIDNGILVLSGTFDSTNAAVAGDRYHHGQIVGYRDSSLILAKPGFIIKRTTSDKATAYDDIGAWGELLRFNKTSASETIIGEETDSAKIFTISTVFPDYSKWETDHCITLPAASISSDVVQIGNKEQYALAALNIQLDHDSHDSTNGVLRFSDTTNELWTMDMKMTANVDLSGTGLLGLTRDNYSCIYKTYVDESDGETKWVVSSGARSTEYSTPERLTYTGTFDGGDNTLTLAIGEKYGKRDNADVIDENKSGRIYNHSFSGLFAQADEATVQNLTVGGKISVSAARDNLYIGSIVARLIGDFDAEGITANTVFTDGGSNSNHNTGGLIGQVYYASTDTSSHEINIGTDVACVFNAEITGSASNTNYIGGVIGRINSAKAGFTLNAEKVTVKNKISQSNTAKSEQTIGGFIGYIDSATSKSSVNSRIINIGTSSNAFSINGLTVNGKVSQAYGNNENNSKDIESLSTGGLLGYAWYDTTVVFHNLDVADSNVYTVLGTNTRDVTPDLAGLVYNATGYWKVDDVSMSTVNIGGESSAVNIRSLGLLVNKGWNSDSALYLELNDSNYSLTNITVNQLQSSKPVYDEIVAYSATYDEKKRDSNNNRINERGEAKVTNNGQGVVSVKTSTRTLNMTGTANTYQNRTDGSIDNSKIKGNPNTRYYYNLDSILRKTDDNKTDAEKLLEWSVYQYAHSSIRSIEYSEIVGNETKTLKFSNPYPSGAIFQSFTTTVENEGEDDETTIETFTGDGFDMTGLSYYPINVSDSVSIKGHVKLYNEAIESREALNGSDSYARTTLSQSTSTYTHSRTQHYLMQNGVFLNITGSLTVDGELYLDGTINTESGVGSGALVCGKIGNTAANPATFSSEDGKIILNGIEVATRTRGTYSPLLINAIGSHANCDFYNIEVYEHSGSETAKYPKGKQVASSLIGNAGDASSEKIQLTFSKIKLDARETANEPALSGAYPTTRSIFTQATLLNKFEYRQNSSAIYNYTKDEDWSPASNPNRYVTYGKEVGYSKKTDAIAVGEYPDREMCYSGSRDYTNPESSSAPATDFYLTGFTKYLKYVATAYVAGESTHQIEVNHSMLPFGGCGTYNHPYSITSDSDLVTIAKVIYGGRPSDGWTVRIQNEGNETNDKWCIGQTECDAYICKYVNASNKYFKLNTDGTTSTTEVSSATIREYLAKAYYSIDKVDGVTLSNEFLGLGNSTDDQYIFRGIIVGHGRTITNQSIYPLIVNSYGSVVKDVNLVVDVTKADADDHTITVNSFGNKMYSKSAGNTYGAVIGKALGGDNIIDQTFVTFKNANIQVTYTNANNANPEMVAVGGYVGVAERGSLIFRNYEEYWNTENVAGLTDDNVSYKNGDTIEENLIKNVDGTPNLKWLYVNPIVGRTLSCAVVTESDYYRPFEDGTRDGETIEDDGDAHYSEHVTMQNTTKDYSIADIAKGNSIDFSYIGNLNTIALVRDSDKHWEYNLNINKAQDLYILSLLTQAGITNSNFSSGKYVNYANGTDQYSLLAYHVYDKSTYNKTGNLKSKMPHTATYEYVGNENITSENEDYQTAKYDETGKVYYDLVPYLIKNYSTKITTKTADGVVHNYLLFAFTAKNTYMNITLPSDKVLYLPDGFRGLGHLRFLSSQNDLMSDLTPHLLGLNGNGSTISLNMSLNMYSNDYYKTNNIKTQYNGFGLFNSVAQNKYGVSNGFDADNSKYQIHNLTISGKVKADYINAATGNSISYTNSATNDDNTFAVGTFAGTTYIQDNSTYLPRLYCFNKVTVSDATIEGPRYAGGLIGRVIIQSAFPTFKPAFNVTLPAGETVRKDPYSKVIIKNCSTDGISVTGGRYAGGLIGHADYCTIEMENIDVQFDKIQVNPAVERKDDDPRWAGAGALIGCSVDSDNKYYGLSISHVTIGKSGSTSSYIGYKGKDNGSAYVDVLAKQILSGGAIGRLYSSPVTIDDCNITNVDVYGHHTGGVIGHVENSGTLTITHTYLDGKNAATLYNCFDASDNATGGFIGVVNDGSVSRQVTIQNGSIKNYKIEDKFNSGGVIGKCTDASNDLKVCDVMVSNCSLKANKYLGDVVGVLTSGNLNGYNILSNSNSHAAFTATDSNTRWGQLVGYNNGQDIKIVGYSRQGTSLETAISNAAENAPVYGSNGYVVFADYNGASRNPVNNLWDNSYISDVFSGTAPEGLNAYEEYNGFSEFNDGSNVSNNLYNSVSVDSLPKYYTYPANFPYVTSMPTFTLFTKAIADGEPLAKKQFLTSDGIGANTSYVPITNIISDIIFDSNKKYGYTYSVVGGSKNQNDDILNITNSISNSPGWELRSNFTTYYDAMEVTNKPYNNFPVLVVDTSNKTESTNLVNSYLRLLTNTNYDFTSDQTGIYSVVLSTVNFTSGTGFYIGPNATGDTATALHRDNGKFFITSTLYDSETDGQFTLIDVQFYDPTGTGEVAYHLYVPVLVKKMLRYNFDTEVLSGTTYLDQPYTQRAALETLGAPITVRIQFSYPEIDWQSMIDNGEDLMWHFNKRIPISTTAGTTIDPDTRIVLIDKNNGKATYYAKYSDVVQGNTIDFSRFTNYDPLEFGEFVLVETTPEEVTVGEETMYYTNEYINLGPLVNNVVPTGATCFDGTNYYRPKAETGDEEKPIVHLKLKSTNVEETYYLTFFTIATSSYVITTDTDAATAIDEGGTMYRPYNSETDENETVYELTFKGGEDANGLDYVDTVRVVNITLRYPASMTAADASDTTLVVPNQYREYHNSNIVIGNLYNQVLTFTTTNGQNDHKMSYPDYNEIDVTMTAQITINDGGSSATKNTLTSYFSTVDVYQSFVVYADNASYDETLLREVHSKTFEGSPTITIDTLTISNLDDNDEIPITNYQINPHYSNTQANQLVNGTSYFEILPQGSAYKLDEKLKGTGAKVTAEFTISYNSATAIAVQFPERYNNQPQYGFELSGTSNLSGDMTSKAYSASQTPQKTDGVRYYCEKTAIASLSYDIPANDSGKEIGLSGEAYDYNQLGINPADSTSQMNDIMHIDAKGFYNLADLPSVAEATKVEWTLELLVKGEDGKYHPVNDMSKYFKTDATHKVSGKSEANSTDGTFNFDLQTKNVSEGGTTVSREYYYKSQEITNHNARGFIIETSYDIITGSAFEAEGFDYSNYQIVLTATLVMPKKENGVIVQGEEEQDTNSIASDYIIYTNARILTEFVKPDN